ncbi:unnamed protein product [Moneuplotes crassus]|uniref:AP2/ERF domain-containing protein n=1 Tax=Euplotes crassus TaxID=5936 RepID=A0AAD1X7D2_EUPCR|nr:unnamed protein product [Moneuplotes crassus]
MNCQPRCVENAKDQVPNMFCATPQPLEAFFNFSVYGHNILQFEHSQIFKRSYFQNNTNIYKPVHLISETKENLADGNLPNCQPAMYPSAQMSETPKESQTSGRSTEDQLDICTSRKSETTENGHSQLDELFKIWDKAQALIRKYIRKTKVQNKARKAVLEALERAVSDCSKSPDQVMIASNPKKEIRLGGQVSKYRGSIFRGVSMNGYKWQVFFTNKNKKQYIGVVQTKEQAASLYDIFEILHHGMKSKTNYSYTRDQLAEILCQVSSLV